MRVNASLIALLLVGLFISPAYSQNNAGTVLMTVDGEPVTLAEFEAIYKKNNANAAVDQKSLEEYLELFINFKLKVKEAEALGLDTVGSFRKELAGYRKQLAQPYLIDRKINEELVQEAYDRMKEDVNVSHILIKVDPNGGPEDTLRAYRKIRSLSARIKNGADFEDLARKTSEDPSAKENGGNLGYFSALQMVYPFESASFNTEVGQLSKPVRTRFGYHLLKVNDRRPSRGKIRAAHIMVKTTADFTPEQNAQAKQKIDELYASLQKGEAFDKVAKLYSDDQTSAKRGGELPVFGTGRMVPEFEDAAFALQKDGDYSEPVKTDYGWHIIKRVERISLAPLSELEGEIKRGIKRDGRGSKSKTALLQTIKRDYGFNPNYSARDEIMSKVDESYLVRSWNKDTLGLTGNGKTLFELRDTKYGSHYESIPQAQLAEFLQERMKRVRNKPLPVVREELWDEFVEEKLMSFEDINLENKHPDFKALVQEYRDGILLFELMDQKVWSKAVKDTTGLEGFYDQNKTDFMWDQRLDASIYTCANTDIATKTFKLAKKRAKKGWSDQYILEKINTESQLDLKIESNKFQKGDNELIDQIEWKTGITEFKDVDGKVMFIGVNQVIEPEPKKLNETRGLVTSRYQTYLEETWIEELRNNYEVIVNKESLSLIK